MKLNVAVLASAAVLMAAPAMAQPAAPASAASCNACHGADGISASPTTPNLAGQKSAYLEAQLRAYRSKDRQHPVMNAMTAALSDDDIKALAAWFGGLPGGGGH